VGDNERLVQLNLVVFAYLPQEPSGPKNRLAATLSWLWLEAVILSNETEPLNNTVGAKRVTNIRQNDVSMNIGAAMFTTKSLKPPIIVA